MSTSDLAHKLNSNTLPKLPHSLPLFPDRMHAVTALLQRTHSDDNSCCAVCSWHLVVALLTEEQQATSQAQGVMWPVLREQCSCATHKERHPTAQIRLACCEHCQSVSMQVNCSPAPIHKNTPSNDACIHSHYSGNLQQVVSGPGCAVAQPAHQQHH